MTRLTSTALTLGLIVIGLPAMAFAQDEMTIAILNNGKPVANVEVVDILNQGKPVGTTGATGQVTFDMNLLNYGKGETVEVWVKDCEDGKVQIVIARQGSDDPCADEDAQAGERCGCRRIGIFVWGGGPVTIDIGTRTVTQTRTDGAAGPGEDHSFADLQFGGMVDYSSFYQLEDTVCEQPGVASCEADGGVAGGGVYFDYRFGQSPFGLSFEGHYAKLDVEQTPTGGGAPTTYDVNSWQFQAMGVYNVGLSPRLGLFGRAGYAIMHNLADALSGSESESRSETGSRFVIGTGLHWPIGEKWCARTNVDLTTGFDSNDADTNARLSFGVGYRIDRN